MVSEEAMVVVVLSVKVEDMGEGVLAEHGQSGVRQWLIV